MKLLQPVLVGACRALAQNRGGVDEGLTLLALVTGAGGT